MHCVDLGESFQTHIYLQNLASIQPRTSPVKFAAPGLNPNYADLAGVLAERPGFEVAAGMLLVGPVDVLFRARGGRRQRDVAPRVASAENPSPRSMT